MAMRLVKNHLLNLNSKKLIRLSSKYVSKDVSVDQVADPVEHKNVVYQDGSLKIVEKKTHTKQMWEKDDFRLARFINKEKKINENFAIDLIADTPPIKCKDRVVSCDGSAGLEDSGLGHPRVFINLDQPGNHSCGYCGLRFYLDNEHHH